MLWLNSLWSQYLHVASLHRAINTPGRNICVRIKDKDASTSILSVHRNEAFITHILSLSLQLKPRFLFFLLLNPKYPASSSPPPPLSHIQPTLPPGPRGSFADALCSPLDCRDEGEALCTRPVSPLHYSDYQEKSYITWGPNAPLRLPLPCSLSSVSSFLFSPFRD